MKTVLPKNSLSIKSRLDQIVKVILDIAREQAVMIILFGSYARGNWVRDWYVEDHITYSYESDLDILLVTKSPKYAGYQGSSLKQKIEEKLQKAGLGWRPFLAPPVTLIIEPIQRINKELEKNRYFFSDIKKEGVILYANKDRLIMDLPDFPAKFLPISREHLKAYQYLNASLLDWTMVCPPDIIDSDPTGNFITSSDFAPNPDSNKIIAADLALFILKEVNKNEYLQHRVGICNE
jgi:predicted nucleotidyltransferase